MSNIDLPKKTKETNWSAVWILPLVALSITLWLGWRAYESRGVMITIEFETGSGIQANKTPIMYKGIEVGKVVDLRIDTATRKVIADVEMDKDIAKNLGGKSIFWLVSPSISLAGVTGLETIISGVYISVEPISGKPSDSFVAQDKPVVLLDNVPGLHLTLQASELGSLDQGAPIYYRQLQVGQVKSYRLATDKKTINVRVLIDEPYKGLVNKNTRFWNTSGVTMSGGLSGFKLHVGPLASLIAGGISFDNLTPEKTNEPVDPTVPFRLFRDFDAAQAGVRVSLKVHELAGLTAGKTQVIYQGVQVGILKNLMIAPDYNGATAILSMNPQVENLLTEGSEFWVVKPSISLAGVSGIDTLLRGTYIEVQFSKTGKPARFFEVRAKAPPLNIDTPGLHLVLVSSELGSLDVGSPVLYKQLKVGSVQSYQLSKDNKKLVLGIHIDPEYTQLVNASTVFWNASGVMIKGGLSGVEIKSESLQSLLLGGIAFDTPNLKAKAVNNITVFPLYPTEDKAKQTGTLVTFKADASYGIVAGAPIKLRGIDVGTIEHIALNPSLTGVEITARITHDNKLLTRADATYWVIKPEIGLMKTANLDTLITGAYVEVQPGTLASKLQTTFNLASNVPLVQPQSKGLRIVLTTPRRGSLKEGLPVMYREIPVGTVVDFSLSPQANMVLVGIVIEPKYATLVRAGSKFWNASGIAVEAGLFKGVKLQAESFETIMAGGIGFATPDGVEQGKQVKPNTVFFLHRQPDEKWLKWAPKIPIKP